MFSSRPAESGYSRAYPRGPTHASAEFLNHCLASGTSLKTSSYERTPRKAATVDAPVGAASGNNVLLMVERMPSEPTSRSKEYSKPRTVLTLTPSLQCSNDSTLESTIRSTPFRRAHSVSPAWRWSLRTTLHSNVSGCVLVDFQLKGTLSASPSFKKTTLGLTNAETPKFSLRKSDQTLKSIDHLDPKYLSRPQQSSCPQ